MTEFLTEPGSDSQRVDRADRVSMLTLDIPNRMFRLVYTLIELPGCVFFRELCFYVGRGASVIHGQIAELKKMGWLRIVRAGSASRPMEYEIDVDKIPVREGTNKKEAVGTELPKPLADEGRELKNPSPGLADPEVVPLHNYSIPPEECNTVSPEPQQIADTITAYGLFPSLLDLAVPAGARIEIPDNPNPSNYRPYFYPKAKLPWLAHYGLDHLCVKVRSSKVEWDPSVIAGCRELMRRWSQYRSAAPMAGEAISHLMRRLNQLAGRTSIGSNAPFAEAIEFLEQCYEIGQKLKAEDDISSGRVVSSLDRPIVDSGLQHLKEGKPIPRPWVITLKLYGIDVPEEMVTGYRGPVAA